ncbi:MAG: transporter substrate-binding domain-containing protein [Oleiphilaceae bacterium]|nr:transporter substrate-binding domain-containing protein [Oleiphilaceae bacterium]
MKKLSLLMGCILAASSSIGFAADKLKLAVDVPYEPFEYKAPDGTLTGFEIDLGNAVCAELKAECEWVIQAWDGIIPGLLARKYDVIFSSMSITPERAEKVLFSEGYYNTPSAWFGKKGTDLDVTDKAAFKGLRVGVQRGTVQDDYVTKDIGADTVEIKRYTTADDLVLDLTGGRLDLVFLDFPVGESTILKDENYQSVGDTMQVGGEGVGAAFRKRDKDLAEKFNAALKKLKEDGTYDEIMNKYFSYSIKI